MSQIGKNNLSNSYQTQTIFENEFKHTNTIFHFEAEINFINFDWLFLFIINIYKTFFSNNY